ncbi:unnamed protein product, partial [Pocillopora meandrina]
KVKRWCDSSADYRNRDFVNKQFVDSKAVTLDPSKGLNMKGNKLDNLADPANATDSSNKHDEDVNGVLITNKDFHKVKTKTYEMNLHLDSNKRYYSSCIGLNRYPFATEMQVSHMYTKLKTAFVMWCKDPFLRWGEGR